VNREDDQKVRVVDKRQFGSDGARRETDVGRTAGSSGDSSEAGSPDSSRQEMPRQEKTTFTDFINSLGASVLMNLGVLSGAKDGGDVDLKTAQSIIEVIDILKEKTAGNLDSQEEKVLSALTAELKLLYAQKVREMNSD